MTDAADALGRLTVVGTAALLVLRAARADGGLDDELAVKVGETIVDLENVLGEDAPIETASVSP